MTFIVLCCALQFFCKSLPVEWCISFAEQTCTFSKWRGNGYKWYMFIMTFCHPEIYADNLLGKLQASVEYRHPGLIYNTCCSCSVIWQAYTSLPNVAFAGENKMAGAFTGHFIIPSDTSLYLISALRIITVEAGLKLLSRCMILNSSWIRWRWAVISNSLIHDSQIRQSALGCSEV